MILESTTYPGSNEGVLVPILERGNVGELKALRDDKKVHKQQLHGWSFAPSVIIPVIRAWRAVDIPKVVGGQERSAAAAAALYGSIFDRVVLVFTPATAEMNKTS